MADTETVQPDFSGGLAPLRSPPPVMLRSEDDFELKVVGRIPRALAGAYYRNGPNPQFDPQGMYLSIFGDGMIHGFFLEPNKEGGSGCYGNRGFGGVGRPAPNLAFIFDAL